MFSLCFPTCFSPMFLIFQATMARGRGREAQPQGRIELRPQQQQQQQQQTEQNILFRLSIDDSTKQYW